jgi:hypothetical protein
VLGEYFENGPYTNKFLMIRTELDQDRVHWMGFADTAMDLRVPQKIISWPSRSFPPQPDVQSSSKAEHLSITEHSCFPEGLSI